VDVAKLSMALAVRPAPQHYGYGASQSAVVLGRRRVIGSLAEGHVEAYAGVESGGPSYTGLQNRFLPVRARDVNDLLRLSPEDYATVERQLQMEMDMGGCEDEMFRPAPDSHQPVTQHASAYHDFSRRDWIEDPFYGWRTAPSAGAPRRGVPAQRRQADAEAAAVAASEDAALAAAVHAGVPFNGDMFGGGERMLAAGFKRETLVDRSIVGKDGIAVANPVDNNLHYHLGLGDAAYGGVPATNADPAPSSFSLASLFGGGSSSQRQQPVESRALGPAGSQRPQPSGTRLPGTVAPGNSLQPQQFGPGVSSMLPESQRALADRDTQAAPRQAVAEK